jgi:acetyl/propionyl-CoA carboxylase alpha subunit
MIGSLLVANRGEIAQRIFRTARRMGLRTIAVFSEADADAPHAREADAAVFIGPAPARESYLSSERVLAAAVGSGADAVHPGYGFLSENADFAQAVVDAGMIWVGPPPAAIRAMGRKDAAKRLMAEAGVPVTPGYMGEDQDPARLAKRAAAIGWPVMIKAVAGGGGKGMRKVDEPLAFGPALAAAKREAASAFGDDSVLLETFVGRPRHIEVQVFGDMHGNFVHLFERDCSLQRRNQKVIEEAPAPGLSKKAREALCATAVRAARAVDYQGAGTVEFIADASGELLADRMWFMEMNTRLQVEHAVTEAVTGLDLVEWQIRVAAGERLPLTQEQIVLSGHAIEARLYAEDPARGFLPSTGRLTRFRLPDGVRVDSGVEEGGAITPDYDPMIAKLIAHAPTRRAAAKALGRACRSIEVWPVKTNAAFLAACMEHSDFIAGAVDTGFIATHMEALTAQPAPSISPVDVGAACLALDDQGPGPAPGPWDASAGASGWRLNANPVETCQVYIDGALTRASIAFAPDARPLLASDGEAIVFSGGRAHSLTRANERRGAGAAAASDGSLRAPMPGKIASLFVIAGEAVKRGQTLLALEAMKMEHALTAPFDGAVAEVMVEGGEQVSEGDLLLRIEAAV